MLLLSLRPVPDAQIDLDEGYSVLAAAALVCYMTGLFALYKKNDKYQKVFLFFLILLIAANVFLAVIFHSEENLEYLLIAAFLILLNSVLAYKAVIVYKKMKGKKN